jgi:hypothetical protein
MIDEAIGKILGMAMAYGASALGMFVAYINYRMRIVKADRIMTPAAWMVILLSALAVAAAVVVVFQIAGAPSEAAPAEPVQVVETPVEVEPGLEPAFAKPAEERKAWPLIGIVLPAIIFLFATWVTAGLHRHFSTHGHG